MKIDQWTINHKILLSMAVGIIFCTFDTALIMQESYVTEGTTFLIVVTRIFVDYLLISFIALLCSLFLFSESKAIKGIGCFISGGVLLFYAVSWNFYKTMGIFIDGTALKMFIHNPILMLQHVPGVDAAIFFRSCIWG